MGERETPPLSKVALSIEVAATKRMDLIARDYPDAISLAQGIPSFDTAEYIKEAAIQAVNDDLANKYTSGFGIEPLREAIAGKVGRDNGIQTTPAKVIVTHGGIEGLMATFLTVLDRDDELLALTPDYASHFAQVAIATGGREATHVPLTETADNWAVDPGRLEDAITDRTRAILITNPGNPIGKVYGEDELREIAQIALKHNLYIISDEMYEYFVFDGRKHISIGSFPEVADRTISAFGLSKSYAMTGWRIGYIVAGQNIIDQIFKVHDSIVTCPTAVSQYAALAAITGPQDVVESYRRTFERRRQIVIEKLATTSRLHLAVPQGAYYAFPRIEGDVDDFKLAMSLIKEAGVVVVPGSAFGKGGDSHIRISFGAEEDALREGLHRLTGYLDRTC